MSFRRIVHTLAGSITELSAASIDENNHYGDLFDRNKNKLGAILPARLQELFPALNVSQESSAEKAIHKAYRNYQDQWFWKRAWLRFTQPINIYRDLSALITLRDLHAQYENNLALFESQDRAIHSPVLFVAMIAGLKVQFSSFLSKSLGFLNALFQPKNIKGPIGQLKQLEKEVRVMLEKNAEQEYLKLLQVVHAKEPNQNWQALETGINDWFNRCADSLSELINALDSKGKSQYQNILDTLKYKHQFLLQAVVIQQEAVNQQALVELAETHKSQINVEYAHLDNRLKNLETGFSLQIDDDEPKHPNTYSVYKNIFNQWQLRYYQAITSSSESIFLEDVAGLEDALNNPLGQPDTIKTAIKAYHKNHLTLNNTNHPAIASAMIGRASPEVLAQNLIGAHSFSLEKNCKERQNLNGENFSALARELLQYCDYVHQKKEALKPLHNALEETAALQLQHYNTVLNACEKNTQQQMIACIRDMAFGGVPIDNAIPLRALREQYEIVKTSEAFTSLHIPAQHRIEIQHQKQIKALKRLIKAIKVVVSQDISDSIGDFFYSLVDAPWKAQVDADFNIALEYILAHQPMLDGAVERHLHEVGIACFYKQSCNLAWSKTDLRLIFQAIEEVKITMLSQVQERTQTLVLLPAENQTEILHQPLLSDALIHLKKLPTVLGQLRLEFKLVLKKPGTDTDNLLDYYRSLTHGLVCRIEAIVWGLVDDENLDVDAQCETAIKEIEMAYKSLALLCHPDKKSDACADNQMKLLIDIKKEAVARLRRVLKGLNEYEEPSELPRWIIDNQIGCATRILNGDPSDDDINSTRTKILIICKNPGYEIGFRNKQTDAYEQRRLPVEHEAFILPHAASPYFKWVTDTADQIKLKQIVASWGGVSPYRYDDGEVERYKRGYRRFYNDWFLVMIDRYNKVVEASDRKAEEAKQETQELRRENQEIKRQAEEAKQETQELRRENQEIRKKIEASDRKTEKVNRRFESLMEQLFSLHPEFQNSDITKETGSKTTQPNNTNHGNRLFATTKPSNQSPTLIEINEITNIESEVISKKSVRVRSKEAAYISDDESSDDYSPYAEKMNM